MDPAVIGTRLASAAIGPLLKKLLVQETPGAGLAGRAPVRLSRLVSFRGEKRTLTEADVRRLAGALVREAVAAPGEPPFPADETEAVKDALARSLVALGDLDMDDVQAVRLGHWELARRLKEAAGGPPAGLSADSAYFLDSLTEWACLHILDFFTRRSTFVARTLVEQARDQQELIAKIDELIRRVPRQDGRDMEFERRYRAYVAKKYGRLTIYGIDLHHSAEQWPLDVAYLSLEATASPPRLHFVGTLASEVERAALDPDVRAAAVIATGADAARALAAERESAIFDAVAEGEADTQLFARLFNDPRAYQQAMADAHVLARRYLHRHFDGPARADLALARHDKVLLRGLAGSGKTTLVQWLAVSAVRDDLPEDMAYLRDRIPFVLPLRALTRHGERLPEPDRFLSAAGCPLAPPEGWTDRVLTAGRGLVLVDGIDEIPEAERDRARRWLRDLLDTYDGDNRWLVTSRPTAVGDDWLGQDGFAELTLSPMSAAEVTTFVERWHRAAGPEAQPYEQPLLDALRTTPDVAALATNPLMCGLICALHRDRRGFLPRGRKALYDAALSMLLLRRDRERDMGNPYGIELGEAAQIQLIQRLAYWLTLNGRTQMDRSHAQQVVRSAVPAVPEAAAYGDPDAVFTHLLHRSGLLREPTADTVDFVHRTFQDYLAAKALVDQWDIGVLVAHAADDQWEDVVRMAVAHARPRECAEIFRELLNAADAAPDRRTRLRIVVVAATALDHATEVAPDVRERILGRTAAVIPPSAPDEARELASVGRAVLDLLPGPEGLDDAAARGVVVTATYVTDDAALPYLARFTDHADLSVRSQLMWGWSRFETRRYAEEIIARLDLELIHATLQSDEQALEVARLGLFPRHLDIRAGVTDQGMAALRAQLGAATSLHFVDRDTPPLASVPPDNRLQALSLLHAPQEGWAALRRLPSLAHLILHRPDELAREQWLDLASLGQLVSLSLPAVPAAPGGLPEGLRLPQLDRLELYAENSPRPFGEIARCFPGLRTLLVDGDPVEPYDLAPLARLANLELVDVAGHSVIGTEHLPPALRLLT
ncbi:NACHT domain-containing protein [Streptomyces tritici]|uniref:NACHT domain-containing protein n=1 Tax=Streptomyces tritici TaxID=2054410 RepID=UPI003AF02337